MPGNDDMINLEEFEKKVKDYKKIAPEYFEAPDPKNPDAPQNKLNHDKAVMLYKDEQEHPEFYVDKALAKARIESQMELSKYKVAQPDLKKEGNIPSAKLLEDLDQAFKMDEAMYRETQYDTPEKAQARRVQFATVYAKYLRLVEVDKRQHPNYHANPGMSDARKFLLRAQLEVRRKLHPEDSEMAEFVRENYGETDSLDYHKTLTDLHNPNPSPEEKGKEFYATDFVKMGIIRDKNGDLFPPGKQPWEYDRMIHEALEKGEPIYLLGKDQHTINVVQSFDGKVVGSPIADPNVKLVNPKKKADVIQNLERIRDSFNKAGMTRRDSAEFKELTSMLNDSIVELKGTAFKANFDKKVKEIAEKADEYIYRKTGQKLNARSQTRVSGARELKGLADAIEEGKVYKAPTEEEQLRRQIAERAVKYFAEAKQDSKNEFKKDYAQHVLESKENFNKAVENAMKNPGFVALFGDDKHPADMDFLRKSASASGKDIRNSVRDKLKTLDEKQIQEIRESQSRTKTAKNVIQAPISMEQRKKFQEQVLEMRQKLSKGYTPGKDKNMDELMEKLENADLRMQTGLSYINLHKMAAEIGDSADRVYKNILASKGDPIEKGLGEVNSLRIIDEELKAGTPISSGNQPVRVDKALATKIVMDTQQKLLKSKDAKLKQEGKLLEASNDLFAKKVKEVMDSKAFKEMIKDKTPEELAKMMEKDSAKLARELGDKNTEMLNKGLTQEKIKEREQKEAQQKKEQEQAQKEKDKELNKQTGGVMFAR